MASVVAGVALVLTALTSGVGGIRVGTEGEVPPPATVTSAPDDATTAARRPAVARSTATPATAPVRPDVTPTQVPAPHRLRIDALGVAAPLVPVALTDGGAMALPDDVHEVGWFSPGPAPGQAGSAVLAGHVDSRTQGRGVLFDLPGLTPGDTVEIDAEDGTATTWRVTGRTAYHKDALPIPDLFRRDGPARLVLITCGGEFDPATGHYADNVVVVAEPA